MLAKINNLECLHHQHTKQQQINCYDSTADDDLAVKRNTGKGGGGSQQNNTSPISRTY